MTGADGPRDAHDAVWTAARKAQTESQKQSANGRDNEGWTAPPVDLCLTLRQWAERDIPPDDNLMGEWLSTTCRVMLVATTGLGKTNFAMALAMAMALGRDLLHWRAHRPARILYIDGEMSRALFKRRVLDAKRRACAPLDTPLFGFCRDDLPEMPPLNTEKGQRFIGSLIERIGGVDFVIFDNVQALLTGDMKDEEPWQQTLPWIRSLTGRRIGQMWVHHTGHDESRSYGTKTREWQLDTVAVLERDKESPAPDIAFELKFTKARQRTPENRADFAAVKITLDGDRWSVEPMEKAKGKPDRMPSPVARKFHAALVDATASSCGKTRQQAGGRVCVTKAEWEAECTRLGLIDAGAEDNQRRALISKYRRELIATEWAACNGDFMWSIK